MGAHLTLDEQCERFFEQYPYIWKDIGADYPKNPHEVVADVVKRVEYWEIVFERRAFWWRRTEEAIKERLKGTTNEIPHVYARKDREVAGTALLIYGLLYGEFGQQGASPVVKLMRSPPSIGELRPLTDEHFRNEVVDAITAYVTHWAAPLVKEYEFIHQPDVEKHNHDLYLIIKEVAETVHRRQPNTGEEFDWEVAKMTLFNERAREITGHHFGMTPDHYRYCSRIVKQRNGWRGPDPERDAMEPGFTADSA